MITTGLYILRMDLRGRSLTLRKFCVEETTKFSYESEIEVNDTDGFGTQTADVN